MNKCSPDDDVKDVLEFYNEAKEQAGAKDLPTLENGNQVLVVERKGGIKK